MISAGLSPCLLVAPCLAAECGKTLRGRNSVLNHGACATAGFFLPRTPEVSVSAGGVAVKQLESIGRRHTHDLPLTQL